MNFKIDGNLGTIYLKAQEKLIVYYYFQDEEEMIFYQEYLELSMKLKVEGDFVSPTGSTIPNGFDYRKYLKRQQIYYLVQAKSITIEKNNTSLLYAIKNVLLKRMDQIDRTGYFRTFILGDKTQMDSDILKEYQSNGVTHLFSISGMHVSLIVGVILFFLDKVSYHVGYKYSVIIPVLLLYLFLTGFSASILRTVLMFILFAINQCLRLKMKKLDIMLLVLIVAIIINPFIIFEIGFQFSYSISFAMIVMNKRVNKVKNKILKNLYLSFLCFVVSFPICVYYFYQVNFLSILFNLLMIPIVSAIIFPMTWITMLFPVIYPIYEKMIYCLEGLNQIFTYFDFLEIIFAKPAIFVMVLYYIVIGLAFWKGRFFIVLFVVILVHKFYPYWDSNFLFTMIDVGQGDSLLIKLPFNAGNILIDTGGEVQFGQDEWKKRKSESSIVEERTLPYLKSLGITKLDYLILTHGDSDHMGEAIQLVKHFEVENVIFNNDDYNDLEIELIKVLNEKKMKYYQNIKELNIDDNIFYFLNNKLYDNENDNSNVIYFYYHPIKMLLMGDAGVEVEEDLIERYHLKDIDVLKVGHHGSKTSSSEYFIDSISPKYSIISVGKNNRYGHPNEGVLNRLTESTVYRTDEDGSIVFKIKKNRLEIKTYAS